MRFVIERVSISIVFLALLMAVALTAMVFLPAAGTGVEGPTSFSGSSSSAVVLSRNSGNGAAVEAASGTVSGGSALVGTGTGGAGGNTTSSTGVLGKVFGPTSNGVVGQAFSTNSTHPSTGVVGLSLNGNGVIGKTSFASTSTANAKAGVMGIDNDPTFPGFNAGVAGTSTNGFGLAGTSTNSLAVFGKSVFAIAIEGVSAHGQGVTGATSSGIASSGISGVLGIDLSTSGLTNFGVYGSSPNGTGVEGVSTINAGVEGKSTSGGAILGLSSSGTGVFGISGSCSHQYTNLGLQGCSDTKVGVAGTSESANGVFAQNFSDSTAALLVSGGSGGAATTGPLVKVHSSDTGIMCGASANMNGDVMSIDQKGDMILCGALTQNVQPLVVHRTVFGQTLGTYTPQQSTATIEDIGKAQLVGGRAYVTLDPTFAAAIDPRADYLVFITPRGDSNGLYVAQSGIRGFMVRENRSGRSTLAFDYRVVAKPFDTNVRRLPLVRLQRAEVHNPPLRAQPGRAASHVAHL